jgi:hypothetical protein
VVKLAFWKTIGETYRLVFTRPLTILRAGWVWLALNIIMNFAGFLFPIKPGAQQPASVSFHAFIIPFTITFVIGILIWVSYISWMIALSRAILLGETSWTTALQFSYRHWRFIGISFLVSLLFTSIVLGVMLVGYVIGIIAAPIMAALQLSPVTSIPRSAIFAAGIGVTLVCALFILTGLELYLPAIAIDDPHGAIRAAWRRSRGNRFRMFFAFIASSLPYMIITGIIFGSLLLPVLLGDTGPMVPFVPHPISSIVLFIVNILWQATIPVFNAFAYKQLESNLPQLGAPGAGSAT